MSNKTVQPHKSSIANLDANLVALLSYLVTSLCLMIPALGYVAWIVPLVVFLLENKSMFVKKHAVQSLVIHILSAVVSLVLRVIIGGLWDYCFWAIHEGVDWHHWLVWDSEHSICYRSDCVLNPSNDKGISVCRL